MSTPPVQTSTFDDQKKAQLEAALAEYNMLREEMRLFLDFTRKDMRIYASVIALILAIAFGYKNLPVDMKFFFVFSPTLVFLITLQQLVIFNVLSAQAKACARIEGQINGLVGATSMDWESFVVPRTIRGARSPNSYAVILSFFVMGALFVILSRHASSVLSESNYSKYQTFLSIAHAIELLGSLFLCGISVWDGFYKKIDERKQIPPAKPEIHPESLMTGTRFVSYLLFVSITAAILVAKLII